MQNRPNLQYSPNLKSVKPQDFCFKMFDRMRKFSMLDLHEDLQQNLSILGMFFFNVFENRFWYLYFWNFVSIKQFQVCFTCNLHEDLQQISGFTCMKTSSSASVPLTSSISGDRKSQFLNFHFLFCYCKNIVWVLKQVYIVSPMKMRFRSSQ